MSNQSKNVLASTDPYRVPVVIKIDGLKLVVWLGAEREEHINLGSSSTPFSIARAVRQIAPQAGVVFNLHPDHGTIEPSIDVLPEHFPCPVIDVSVSTALARTILTSDTRVHNHRLITIYPGQHMLCADVLVYRLGNDSVEFQWQHELTSHRREAANRLLELARVVVPNTQTHIVGLGRMRQVLAFDFVDSELRQMPGIQTYKTYAKVAGGLFR